MKKYWLKILLILTFLFSAFLLISSARLDSQTTDEAIHLVAGYSYLTAHDFRLNPEHPPLIKELSALPILLMKNVTPFLTIVEAITGNVVS